MSEAITEILAICLERMEAGASLESCLADFPNQASELEPLLQMTQQMKRLTNVGPRPTFARNARLLLENQLAERGKAVTSKRENRHTRQEPKLLLQRRFSMSLLQFIVAAVLALTATTGGVAYAANASSPGDFLHGLDLAMENIQLNLAPDVASKVQLRLEFASERLAEAHTTFSENDVTDGLEAVNEYGQEISAIAQLVGGPGGADQEALASLLETAQGVHTQVLTALLDKVPEQARDSIQKAIDASSSPAGIPGPTSTPVATSVSNDVGESNATGTPEAVGTPNGAGRPEGIGTPNRANAPGTDISACATSLSQENAQALADLARNHGVDYQYVLENFCTLGTIERVQEMLSGLHGPPTNVPAGPPDDKPGGPPPNIPGGPPIKPPGKP